MTDDNTTPETLSFHKRNEDEPTPERSKVPIFSVGDRTFYIENRARPNLTFGYMRRLRTEGEAAAEAYMMDKMLGLEALEALEELDDFTPEDHKALTERMQVIASGGAGKA